MSQTYYEVLGVSEHATNSQIVSAYQQKVASTTSHEQLSTYSKAYLTLIDPYKRQTYNNSLQPQQPYMLFPSFPSLSFPKFDNIFNNFFNNKIVEEYDNHDKQFKTTAQHVSDFMNNNPNVVDYHTTSKKVTRKNGVETVEIIEEKNGVRTVYKKHADGKEETHTEKMLE